MAEPTSTVPGRLSVADYRALPDDGKRYELLDGVLEEVASPHVRHQRIVGRLHILLFRSLQERGLGEVLLAPCDAVLDEHTALQPDLLFVRAERAGVVEREYVRGAPDLVVEVLSESTRRKDVVRKARLYARAGVPWYWIVDPEVGRVEFLRREGGGYELAGSAERPAHAEPPGFPGVRLPLDELFR
jgi:Uma2 family endonuclease